jgi:hypothetical protein
MTDYLVEIPGLAEAVAGVPADARDQRHKALLKALRSMPGLDTVEFATSRGDCFLATRRVFTAAGDPVHDDLSAWLSQEFVNDGARASVTHRRLLAEDLRLSRTEVTSLYLVVDRGGDESNFLQIEIELLSERMSNRLMQDYGLPPRDVRELLSEAEGQELQTNEQEPLGTPRYQLRRVVDMPRFLELIDADEERQRARVRALRFTVSDPLAVNPQRDVAYKEIDPGIDKYAAKGRRLFRDWAASSAGQSGQRLCRHWVMQISDSGDKTNSRRWVSLVPMWTYDKKLAKVDSRKGSVSALYDRLCAIDRRTGAPFAWFFYLLHGNRVREGAGHRILEAAEAGQIDLPESDYQVLRRWSDREYGF